METTVKKTAASFVSQNCYDKRVISPEENVELNTPTGAKCTLRIINLNPENSAVVAVRNADEDGLEIKINDEKISKLNGEHTLVRNPNGMLEASGDFKGRTLKITNMSDPRKDIEVKAYILKQ